MEKNERKQLTRADVLERLREIWELLPLDGEELTAAQGERVEMNFSLAKLWCDVTGNREVSEVSAIGFSLPDDDEDESGEDWEE